MSDKDRIANLQCWFIIAGLLILVLSLSLWETWGVVGRTEERVTHYQNMWAECKNESAQVEFQLCKGAYDHCTEMHPEYDCLAIYNACTHME